MKPDQHGSQAVHARADSAIINADSGHVDDHPFRGASQSLSAWRPPFAAWDPPAGRHTTNGLEHAWSARTGSAVTTIS